MYQSSLAINSPMSNQLLEDKRFKLLYDAAQIWKNSSLPKQSVLITKAVDLYFLYVCSGIFFS